MDRDPPFGNDQEEDELLNRLRTIKEYFDELFIGKTVKSSQVSQEMKNEVVSLYDAYDGLHILTKLTHLSRDQIIN